MTESEMREKIARLPIKAQWKARLLNGTHMLHWYPDSLSTEDDYVLMLWKKRNYSLTCMLFEDGEISGHSMLNGKRTGLFIAARPGSDTYCYGTLDNFLRDEELEIQNAR